MNKQEYEEYLKSSAWRQKRHWARLKARGKCQRCGELLVEKEVHTHHLTYERVGHERPEDLQVICKACHEFIHGLIEFDPADKEGLEERIRKYGIVSGNRSYEGDDAIAEWKAMKEREERRLK
jgi:HNH endonuclease